MLDGIRACINRNLDVRWRESVDGNFQVLAVGLLDNGSHFRLADGVLDRNLDDVDVVEDILTYCLPGLVDVCYQVKFLFHNCMGKGGIKSLDIITRRRKLTRGGQNSRTGNVACMDRV